MLTIPAFCLNPIGKAKNEQGHDPVGHTLLCGIGIPALFSTTTFCCDILALSLRLTQ